MNISPGELDLFSEEISPEDLTAEALPDSAAAFSTFGCASTFGTASGGTKGTGSTFGTLSS